MAAVALTQLARELTVEVMTGVVEVLVPRLDPASELSVRQGVVETVFCITEELGLAVVRVRDATSALAELQQLLGLDLGVTAGTARIRPGMEIDQARLQHYLQHKLQLSGTSTQYQVPGTSSPLQAS